MKRYRREPQPGELVEIRGVHNRRWRRRLSYIMGRKPMTAEQHRVSRASMMRFNRSPSLLQAMLEIERRRRWMIDALIQQFALSRTML